METAFRVLLNALYMARPAVEMALDGLVEDPAKWHAELRDLEAACNSLKQDANALAAILIARSSDDDMLTEAEVLFRYFEQVEAQTAAIIEMTV